VVLDATASMTQADQPRPQRSRLDVAKGIATCALQVALQGGDRFGLLTVIATQVQPVQAGGGARHRDRCLLALEATAASGTWPDAARLSPAWDLLAPRSLVCCSAIASTRRWSEWRPPRAATCASSRC
jgi:uncharacterized protein (DUF58 family)